jgi:hypothetical protein
MKILNQDYIPQEQGYKFAAVDSNGSAYAYKTKPSAGLTMWETNDSSEKYHFIGNNFDTLDWENSLVSVD